MNCSVGMVGILKDIWLSDMLGARVVFFGLTGLRAMLQDWLNLLTQRAGTCVLGADRGA